MKSKKRPEVVRIAALVGEAEAEAYVAIHAACTKLARAVGDRFLGGGGIALTDPKGVEELGGVFRPGFVVFADELAGDRVAWDVRRGPPRAGQRPPVLYIDHEIGFATPFARGVGGAIVHVLALALIGTPRGEMSGAASQWLPHLGPVLAEDERVVLERLVRAATKKDPRPVFANDADARRAVRALLPDVPRTLGTLPPTHLPLLDDSKEALDGAIVGYEEAVAVYREMVHDEGRRGYAWWLAAAARGLSDVLLRRRRWEAASEAATCAIEHYEPIFASGDGRVAVMLAFAHRVVATVAARSKRWATAYEHAERALELQEGALADYAAAVTGLGAAVEAWELDLVGGDADRARGLLGVATRHTGAFVGRTPPHAFAEQGERLARLAARRSKRRR